MVFWQSYRYGSSYETGQSLFCNFMNQGDEKPDIDIFSKHRN